MMIIRMEKIVEDFKPYPKVDRDYVDWGYRKYKIIGEATNKFNKGTNKPFKPQE